jgi:hypothetical protein
LNRGKNAALLHCDNPNPAEKMMTGSAFELAFVVAISSALFFSAWHFVAPLFG